MSCYWFYMHVSVCAAMMLVLNQEAKGYVSDIHLLKVENRNDC
jgi:hypothetical protein